MARETLAALRQPVTLLAPTDEAFAHISPDVSYSVSLHNQFVLVFLYHVLVGRHTAAGLAAAAAAAGANGTRIATLAPNNLPMTVAPGAHGGVAFQPGPGQARLVDADAFGDVLFLVQGIDRLLISPAIVPPDSIVPASSPLQAPQPPSPPPVTPTGGERKHSSDVGAIAGVLGGAAVLLAVAILLYVCCMRRRATKPSVSTIDASKIFTDVSMTQKAYAAEDGHTMVSLSQTFGIDTAGVEYPFQALVVATRNFADDMVVGVGGFGKVYKGVMEDGTAVAVKRFSPDSHQGISEFLAEMKFLTKVKHPHLVSLILHQSPPHCMHKQLQNLALPLQVKGKDAELHGAMPWKQRLQICIGAAEGLAFLHTGAAQSIIHRDVKSTNILLDEHFDAKVSDFGLSRMGPGHDESHVSTVVKGSVGYMDPEYFRRLQLTELSDVYSFGIVLLEVLCARPPFNTNTQGAQVILVEWAGKLIKQGIVDQILDPKMAGTYNAASIRLVADLASKCISSKSAKRPAMSEVLRTLKAALVLQEEGEPNDAEVTTPGNQWSRLSEDEKRGSPEKSKMHAASSSSASQVENGQSKDSSQVSLRDLLSYLDNDPSVFTPLR
eukprot:SM000279S10391  [mRNA]  locus=s279:140500:144439:- [translate_table: standard]